MCWSQNLAFCDGANISRNGILSGEFHEKQAAGIDHLVGHLRLNEEAPENCHTPTNDQRLCAPMSAVQVNIAVPTNGHRDRLGASAPN
jgi:hypothetical protein